MKHLKKTFLVVACLFYCLPADLAAQAPVQWSAPEELGDEEASLQSYSLADGRSYTIEARQFFNLSVRVTLYDASKKKIGRKQLKFEKQNKMWGVAGALHQYINLNGKYYFITDEPMPAKGSITLLAWEFTPETLTLADQPIELANSKGQGVFRQGRFHYIFNQAHTKLFVLEIPGQEKDGMEEWNVKEFDRDFKQVNERTVPLPYEASKFAVTRIDIDGRGNLILSCILFKKGGPLSEIFSADYTILYAIVPAAASEVQFVSLDFGEKIVHDNATIIDESKGNVYVYGFYSNRRTDLAQGIFECNFSMAGEVLDKQLYPFPAQVIQGFNRTDKLRTKSEVQYLKMVNVLKNSDGTRQFVAEQMLLTHVITTYNTGFTTTQDQFTSGDILVFKLYPDQTRNWYSLIPKKQVSLNDGGRFLSFRHQFLPNGSVRIIYNDSPSNLLPNVDDAVKMNNRQFCTVFANVSPEGSVSKTRLFGSDEIGHRLLVDGIKFSGDQIFFMAVSKKTFVQGALDARTIN